MDRRKFLELAALSSAALATSGTESLFAASGTETLPATSAGASSKNKAASKNVPDKDLVVFISDLHCNDEGFQKPKLEKLISGILKLNPLPANVIALGDLAKLTGKVTEYETLRTILKPLEDAGITLTLGMGNHDRREEFASIFPEQAAKSLFKDRLVYDVSTPRADFIVLDSLRLSPDPKTWITDGALNGEQVEWLAERLKTASKPALVCAHHPIYETGISKLLCSNYACCGYIYGHNHMWRKDWVKLNYKDPRIVRCLCLPSTGHWGDIGFTTVRMERDKAVATLHELEFFFALPLPEGMPAPEQWRLMMEENNGDKCNFLYKFEI